MTIYPAKNHRGRYTGSWTVEVMRKGERFRATAPDFVSAEQIERALKVGRAVPKDLVTYQALKRQATIAERAEYKLGRLEVEAGRRLSGSKDEAASRRRLAVMIALLGPDTPVKHIRYADLEKAADALARQGLKPKTVNRYLAAISGALRWARKQGIIEQAPPKPWRKESKGRVVFVPQEADEPMREWFMDRGKPVMALIYAVLVSTGLRITELRTLEPHEVSGGFLRLNDTKNNDARDVPINDALALALRQVIEQGTMPAYEAIRRAFVAASEDLGLGVRVTPHVLRHTTATRLNSAGVPTATVQRFLGHRDVRTTLNYTHADNAALVAAARFLSGPGKPW